MPLSDHYNIPWVITTIMKLRPKSILDVGIGFGSYGALIRNYCEHRGENSNLHERQITLDGIEIFPSYENKLWEVYDRIVIGDVRERIDDLGDYDMILVADVIEHFEKDDGFLLLNKLLEHATYVLVTTPNRDYPQGAVYSNEHETHLSRWVVNDFSSFSRAYVNLHDCVLILLSRKTAISKSFFDFLPRLTTSNRTKIRLVKNNTKRILRWIVSKIINF